MFGSSEELFRSLSAAHARSGCSSPAPTVSCTFVNERWCELTGLSFDEALGDGWFAALHPDDRERVLGRMGRRGGRGT